MARDITNVMKSSTVSIANKLRVMLLYVVTQSGLKDDNVASLASTASFGAAEQKAVESLKLLSVTPDKKKKSLLEMLGVGSKAPERAQYELSRHICPLTTILRALVDNSLETTAFPFLHEADAKAAPAPAPSKKSASLFRSDAPAAAAESSEGSARPLLVFVAGGLSYAEMRAAYTAVPNAPVALGSSALMQPEQFVRQLQHLDDAEAPPSLKLKEETP